MSATTPQVVDVQGQLSVTPSVQAGRISAEKLLDREIRVTPAASTSFAPGEDASTGKLLDGSLHVVPPIMSRHLQDLFKDLRDRQEESFKRVLDQQQELQNQMLVMTSTLKASIDSQALLQARNEDGIAEFRKLLIECPFLDTAASKRPATENAMQNGDSDASKKSVTPAADKHLQAAAKRLSRTSFAAKAASMTSQTSVKSNQRHIQITAGSDEIISADEPILSLRARVSKFLKHKEFQLGIGLALFINAFIMCWEAQYNGLQVGFNLEYRGRPVEAHIIWPGAATVFQLFDWFFGCLFFAEMAAKLVCWQGEYFFEWQSMIPQQYYSAVEGQFLERKSSPLWQCLCSVQYLNILDFFCVVGFVTSKMAGAGIGNPQLPRLLRLFRFGRLVRLLRFMESLDHLYVMTTALSALRDVLSWAIILLVMMLLTCDLFLIQVLHATYFDEVKASDLTEDQLKRHHEMYEYFGTWTRCILSMFELTLGNFPPVARLLTEEVSEWFTVFCLVHKLTFGFAVLGVINGVILQETFKVASTDDLILYREKFMAKETLKKKFQGLFEDLDESGDGKLEIKEVERIGELPEIKTWLGSLGIETNDLRTLFELIDADGNGYVTIDEVFSQLPHIRGTARSADVLQLLNIQRHLIAAIAMEHENLPNHDQNLHEV